MNSDITFDSDLFEEGIKVKQGEVLVSEGIEVNWKYKSFQVSNKIDTFTGRCFFITAKDFIKTKFNPLLPHYLSDIDYGLRLNARKVPLKARIYHKEHSYGTGLLSPANPIIWTIFLILHGKNRYFLINLIKIWL